MHIYNNYTYMAHWWITIQHMQKLTSINGASAAAKGNHIRQNVTYHRHLLTYTTMHHFWWIIIYYTPTQHMQQLKLTSINGASAAARGNHICLNVPWRIVLVIETHITAVAHLLHTVMMLYNNYEWEREKKVKRKPYMNAMRTKTKSTKENMKKIKRRRKM